MKTSLGAKTIVYPAPVFIVGTFDEHGKPNVMTAAWGGICCSRPPCVAVSLRKATYTYRNIQERRAFTINIPSEAHAKVADYFGIASGKTVDKLAAVGLHSIKSDLVDAPYIQEFLLVLECRLLHVVEIGLHTQFVGEILDVKADPTVLDESGMPDIKKIKPILYAPEVRDYYGVGELIGKAFSLGKGFLKL
ncbi:MAG: flavin reductase family protein [Candidatus Aminicenantes bacterium]|nr:flavin reductase family protein [Candidatus Aminicenantes bacterium]